MVQGGRAAQAEQWACNLEWIESSGHCTPRREQRTQHRSPHCTLLRAIADRGRGRYSRADSLDASLRWVAANLRTSRTYASDTAMAATMNPISMGSVWANPKA